MNEPSTRHYAVTDWVSSSLVNIQHWIWLEVLAPPTVRHPRATIYNRHYIPRDIVNCIPHYKALSEEKLASIEGHDEPIIRDTVVRDPQIVTDTIRFLASGHLNPLNASSGDCEEILYGLFELFQFGDTFSIVKLCTAVVEHIDRFTALPLKVFLAVMRKYYTHYHEDVQNRMLALLIKRKLAEYLPQLQQTMTNEEISSESGILGKQLMMVLLEDRDKKDGASSSKTESKTKTEIKDE